MRYPWMVIAWVKDSHPLYLQIVTRNSLPPHFVILFHPTHITPTTWSNYLLNSLFYNLFPSNVHLYINHTPTELPLHVSDVYINSLGTCYSISLKLEFFLHCCLWHTHRSRNTWNGGRGGGGGGGGGSIHSQVFLKNGFLTSCLQF